MKSGNGREDLWEVPGGRYDVGEETLAPQEVIAREITEELGPAFQCHIGQPVAAWIRPLMQDFVFLLAYDCHYQGGEIQLSPEHVEFRWVTRNSWRDLPLAPGYEQALDQYWKMR